MDRDPDRMNILTSVGFGGYRSGSGPADRLLSHPQLIMQVRELSA
jgi:hypothetical protein